MNRGVNLLLVALMLTACAPASSDESAVSKPHPPSQTQARKPQTLDFQLSSGATVLVAQSPSTKQPEVHTLSNREVTLRATVKNSEQVRFVARMLPKELPALVIGPVVPTGDGNAVATWQIPSSNVYIVWAEAVKRPDVPVSPGDTVDHEGNWVAASSAIQVQYHPTP